MMGVIKKLAAIKSLNMPNLYLILAFVGIFGAYTFWIHSSGYKSCEADIKQASEEVIEKHDRAVDEIKKKHKKTVKEYRDAESSDLASPLVSRAISGL